MAVSLGLGLGISVSGTTGGAAPAPTTDRDAILTENNAFLLTENDDYLVRQIASVNVLSTQADDDLITQDGSNIELNGLQFLTTQECSILQTQSGDDLLYTEIEDIQLLLSQAGDIIQTQAGEDLRLG